MFSVILMAIFALAVVVAVYMTLKFTRKMRANEGKVIKEGDRYTKEKVYDNSDDKFARLLWSAIAGAGILAIAITGFFSTFYTQSVGEAKVLINFDGTIAGEDITPGAGFKAPWQGFSDWDLFSQEASYANDGTTNYTGGTVTGPQITSSVKNGAAVNMDLSVVYSIEAEDVTPLYKQFRTQERFTKQVIETAIRSATRDIPSKYSAVDFRGDKRGEAQAEIQTALQEKLEKYGVKIDVVNLQEVRYTDDVEQALKNVEVANQAEAEAAAKLRATEISAQAQVVEATAAAEANRLLAASLTPEVLRSKYIEAMKKGTVFVVPEGSDPLIQVK